MKIFKIIAECESEDSREKFPRVTLADIQGTFAEEVYESCEKKFWQEIQKCSGCKYENNEEWEMPCCKCRRMCRDYYRE